MSFERCATIMQTRCNRREQIVECVKRFYDPEFIHIRCFSSFPFFILREVHLCVLTRVQAILGIPDTYPVIKIIDATIKVLATQRIRTITDNLRRANRVLLRIRIHVRKRKFKINRGELWDD